MNYDRDCPRCERNVYTEAHFDARGIYITRCCDDCWKKVRKGYRPEVLDDPNYDADEPINPDDDLYLNAHGYAP